MLTQQRQQKDKLLHFSPFHRCLNVILRPEEGYFPENLHRVIYVIINKLSFESFMCLDLRQCICKFSVKTPFSSTK